MGEEGGGVSQAMATEPTARTGETGAGEGTMGEGQLRTAVVLAAVPRPAGGGGLNAGSNQGQTFLLRVFLLKLASTTLCSLALRPYHTTWFPLPMPFTTPFLLKSSDVL